MHLSRPARNIAGAAVAGIVAGAACGGGVASDLAQRGEARFAEPAAASDTTGAPATGEKHGCGGDSGCASKGAPTASASSAPAASSASAAEKMSCSAEMTKPKKP